MTQAVQLVKKSSFLTHSHKQSAKLIDLGQVKGFSDTKINVDLGEQDGVPDVVILPPGQLDQENAQTYDAKFFKPENKENSYSSS